MSVWRPEGILYEAEFLNMPDHTMDLMINGSA